MTDDYDEARLYRLLAEDSHLGELGIDVRRHGRYLIVEGQVESEARRQEVVERVAAAAPDCVILNELEVSSVEPPAPPYDIS